MNVADLTQDELTVFAVKNKNTASRAAVLDTASIKNHIVKGRYAKEDLTDGSTLTSISNETLYVTRTENDVQINGVKIEGNAIPAGNSYVYVVPEVIPTAEVPLVPLHATHHYHQVTYRRSTCRSQHRSKRWKRKPAWHFHHE